MNNNKKIDLFTQRIQSNETELKEIYSTVYTDNPFYDSEFMYEKLLKLMKNYILERKPKYIKADTNAPNWYHSNKIIGITLYVDLFSSDLINFKSHIPYFKELGINLIHFMPILEGRPGENDGGYAVKNYKQIDPKFGTTEDFISLIDMLKKNKIHSCIDFVVNHTAKEHEFAREALEGNNDYMNMYLMYDNYDIPASFEQSVPEVFPKVAPGNFTYYDEINKWVFTSFYEFQWDLNYQNPLVFEKIIDILLYLANIGVDMIRLDAIPFMWKELGHSCRNHPMIHKLLRMMNLIIDIVCPSVALLGEAIVEPSEIIKYFGEKSSECNIMYNATHMVNLWNSIATRDTTLLQIDAGKLHPKSQGAWINYARCHDDIGWGFNEEAITNMGLKPYDHKQFLINFYKGDFDGSFSIGKLYEFNTDTMDARNCGTMASLLGLEQAIINKDLYQKELAIKRINLIHSILLSSPGIPLIYSGDEIATINNYEYLDDPLKAHDSRWIHRSSFNHEIAKLRKIKGTRQGLVFDYLKTMISIRKTYDILAPTVISKILDTKNNHIYCFYKIHEGNVFIALFNFSEDRQFVNSQNFHQLEIHETFTDLLSGKIVDLSQSQTLLGPYECLWLCNRDI